MKLALVLLFLASCARIPLRRAEQAMRPAPADRIPALADDLPMAPLAQALKEQIALLRSTPQRTMSFGPQKISREAYATALEKLLPFLNGSPEKLQTALAEHFTFHEVYGDEEWGDVFMTSYYETLAPGSRRKRAPFTQALYKLPPDLVEMHLSEWENLPEGTPTVLRGRLDDSAGSEFPSRILPYPSRADIDEKQALKGRSLEWCWVTPEDAFWMQIQGSGVVRFADGKSLALGYAGQNGHPYVPIGKFLVSDTLPAEDITLQRIEEHLAGLGPQERQELFNKNPSYVFFKKLPRRALTFLGLPALAGRTIATDRRFFPKGALALLAFSKPDDGGAKPVARLVLDQDVGGAIKGGGRLDLFWGSGAQAKHHAGRFKERGKLLYLLPKLDKTTGAKE